VPRESSSVDAAHERRFVVLRTVGVGVGVVLTALALWLIVTSTTQKSLEIGVLVGIWGVVIAASCAVSNRAHEPSAQAGTAPAQRADQAGEDLAVRARNEVGLAAELERGGFQAQLEHLLRTELRNVVLTEVERLRAEVADLRRELTDTAGGQLRLERVETTRVIGSNLESMHHQLQRLSADDPASAGRTVDAQVVDPGATGQPAPPAGLSSPSPTRRGGRRRAADADNDVLARILARERRAPESGRLSS
jgi:hypothetical protein